MSNTSLHPERAKSVRAAGFWAVIRYELLWNIRKKKVLGMVIIALVYTTIIIAVTPALSNLAGIKITANPEAVVTSGGINSFIMFLLAMVTAMNSISGEFESGTIIPLLTKPVSRTTVFLGKVTAALLTLIPVYILIYVITIIGDIMVYGSQNNLYLVPLMLIGSILSTLIWMAIVFSISSITKSSLFSALGPFLIYVALALVVPIISLFSGAVWALTYVPGGGNTGYLVSSQNSSLSLSLASISTGTDGLAGTLVSYALHPNYYVAFVKLGITSSSSTSLFTVIMTEPILYVLLTAVGVAFAYIAVFSFVAWFALRRAQISE